MITLVQKYGGTSVESPKQVLDVARRVLEEKHRGRRILIVVSAMGQSTDELLALAQGLNASPPRREMDMLLSAGERISMALLAIALDSLHVPAISFTGSQSGIITDDRHSDARIVAIRPIRIADELERGRVVIIAGFQGVSSKKEVTTLGRGGSDTTAVALAVHFGSPWCEIYTDVQGVMTADPRIVAEARTLPCISHETAIVLSHLGAQVLFRRAVILARKSSLPLRVCCSLSEGAETWIGDPPEEATVNRRGSNPSPPMETDRILSVALEPHCVAIEAEGKLPPDETLRRIAGDAGETSWSWIDVETRPGGCLLRAVRPIREGEAAGSIHPSTEPGLAIRVNENLGIVSLVGEGIAARGGLLAEAATCLRRGEIEVVSARTSSLSISFLVRSEDGPKAVRFLHKQFVENA